MNTLERVLRTDLFTMRSIDAHWREVIDAAGLPEPARSLVERVVMRTRLRRSERREVARELCAHFADGIAAGRDPAALVADFGDPSAAARLIRRAMIRKRSWIHRATAWAGRGLAAAAGLALVATTIFAIRYWSGEPTIARNYMAEHNESIAARAELERAWPKYAEVLSRWASREQAHNAERKNENPRPAALEHHARVASLLPEIRAAAARPVLGILLSTRMDPAIAAYLERTIPPSSSAIPPEEWSMATGPEDNPALFGVLLPHLQYLREWARTLVFDAELALEERDITRWMANFDALLGMGAQCRGEGILISTMVGLSIQELAMTLVSRALAQQPGDLSDAEWARVAHALAAAKDPQAPLRALEFEATSFEDVLQRCFTDDGNGDGRLTPEGARLLALLSGNNGREFNDAAGLAMASVTAGRRENREMYLRFIEAARADAALPLAERKGVDPDGILAAWGPLERQRYAPVNLMMPSIDAALAAFSLSEARLDTLAAAIALELHKRRQGTYPTELAAIVPEMIPSVPRDPYDNAPIRYALRDGKPLLYSIGVDRKDNGGVVPPGSAGNATARSWRSRAVVERESGTPAGELRVGDWIIWPEPPAPEEKEPT